MFSNSCTINDTLYYFDLSHYNGHKIFSGAFAVLFVSTCLFLFVYLRFMLKSVDCPKCGERCETKNDKSIHMWIAICKKCDVNWNLGVGSKSDTNMT